MKSWIPLLTGFGGGAVAGAILVALQSGPQSSTREAALAAELDSVKVELDTLRRGQEEILRLAAAWNPATAEAPPARQEAAPAASVKAASTPVASAVDRDAVFALIREERDLREAERQENRAKLLRDGIERQVTRAAERIGLDKNATQSLVKLYLENLDREAAIRKAYPVSGRDDPAAEKRALELQAARKQLESAAAAYVPEDKRESWERSTRFLRRSGDVSAALEGETSAMESSVRGLLESRTRGGTATGDLRRGGRGEAPRTEGAPRPSRQSGAHRGN